MCIGAEDNKDTIVVLCFGMSSKCSSSQNTNYGEPCTEILTMTNHANNDKVVPTAC